MSLEDLQLAHSICCFDAHESDVQKRTVGSVPMFARSNDADSKASEGTGLRKSGRVDASRRIV